jgi:hypothetical protein
MDNPKSESSIKRFTWGMISIEEKENDPMLSEMFSKSRGQFIIAYTSLKTGKIRFIKEVRFTHKMVAETTPQFYLASKFSRKTTAESILQILNTEQNSIKFEVYECFSKERTNEWVSRRQQ